MCMLHVYFLAGGHKVHLFQDSKEKQKQRMKCYSGDSASCVEAVSRSIIDRCAYYVESKFKVKYEVCNNITTLHYLME